MSEPSNIVQRIACKGLIMHDGKLLILREAETYVEGSNTGKWHLPGGRLNPGEPFLDGLKREILEETGLTVTVGDVLYVGEWFPVIRDIPNQIVGMFFACFATSRDVKVSEEHDEFKWVSEDELGNFQIMDPDPEAIRRAFAAATT